MAEPLKYKIEHGLRSYLAGVADLSAFTVQAGQNPLAVSPPCIAVFLNGMREASPDSMVKRCEMQVEIITAIDADDDGDNQTGENSDRTANWEDHRAAVKAAEGALQDLAAMKAYLNKVNVINRPVTAFYLYDILEENQSSSFAGEDRVLVSVIQVTCLCEAQDN